MARTFIQFQTDVARKLGVISITQPLSAEDGAVIENRCRSLQDELSALVAIDFDDGIDEQYAAILTDMAAALLVDEFMIAEPRATRIKAEGQLGLSPMSPAEIRLRKQVALTAGSDPVRVDFY